MAGVGGALAGTDKQIKEEDSLAKKIHDRALQGGVATPASLDKSASKINDALRYTAVLETSKYMEARAAVKTALPAAGYTYVKEGNAWADPARFGGTYRGINMTFKTADGLEFELQLHTRESLAMKEEFHALYKELQNAATPEARKAEIKALLPGMQERFGALEVPPGAAVAPPASPRRRR